MKATLLAILTLGSLAMADTVTTDLISTTSTDKIGGFGGFDFSVGAGSKFTSAQITDYSTITGLTLNSIELDVYKTWYTNRHCDVGFGAAIFAKDSDLDTWTLIGKTNWWNTTPTAYEGSVKLTTTEALTLTIDKTYTVAFFAGKDYFDNTLVNSYVLTAMPDKDEWKTTSVPSDTSKLAAVGIRGADMGAGSTNGIVTYSPESLRFIPNVKLNVTMERVPEPATGTLSLLALAGLCIRRRK